MSRRYASSPDPQPVAHHHERVLAVQVEAAVDAGDAPLGLAEVLLDAVGHLARVRLQPPVRAHRGLLQLREESGDTHGAVERHVHRRDRPPRLVGGHALEDPEVAGPREPRARRERVELRVDLVEDVRGRRRVVERVQERAAAADEVGLPLDHVRGDRGRVREPARRSGGPRRARGARPRGSGSATRRRSRGRAPLPARGVPRGRASSTAGPSPASSPSRGRRGCGRPCRRCQAGAARAAAARSRGGGAPSRGGGRCRPRETPASACRESSPAGPSRSPSSCTGRRRRGGRGAWRRACRAVS